ncbi:MAG: MBL fold metallo-hydrolase [Euryarchaeota archaeon]|nr:MBL fold metallo-hydrolase [Euryarchaeota archaeon]
MDPHHAAPGLRQREHFTEVAEGVFFIRSQGEFHANSLLILDEATVLLDTGNDQVKALPPVGRVLNSHYHLDHIYNNHRFPAPWVPRGDREGIESREGYRRLCGVDDETLRREVGEPFHFLGWKPVPASRDFQGGDTLDFGETRWEVIGAPGHSPGHVAFHESALGLLYASDIDLTRFGPWYGWPTCNLEEFEASVERLQSIARRCEWVLTSHAKPIPRPKIEERFRLYHAVFAERDTRLLDLCREPQALDPLVSRGICHGAEQVQKSRWDRYFEKVMLQMHLDRLQGQGKIERENGTYRSRRD